MAIKSKIEGLLQEKFEETENQDLFLVEVKYHPSQNKVLAFVDADNGLSLDRCKKLSRYLEDYLDTSLDLGEDYTLEVSSPGLDRPLQSIRQYKKNVGRWVEIETEENERIVGQIMQVNEEFVTFEIKKKKKTESIEVPFVDIKKALIQIKF